MARGSFGCGAHGGRAVEETRGESRIPRTAQSFWLGFHTFPCDWFFQTVYPNGGCISWRRGGGWPAARRDHGTACGAVGVRRCRPGPDVDASCRRRRRHTVVPARWHSGATPPAKGSAGDLSSMLNSFAARFSVALNRGDGAESSPPADSGVTDPAVVSARRARIAKREQVFACKEVAAQLIGAQEVLDLQKLAREHCRRPCETFRATMLRAAAAVGAATMAADSGGAQRSARLATIEAEAEAAALATLGGGVGGGSSGGVSGPELAPDAFVDALTTRVMRAVEVTLGAAIDREARAALHRRPVVLQDFDKAAALTHRLAFSRLHRHARPLVAAVARAARAPRRGSRPAAPQAATQGLGHDPARVCAVGAEDGQRAAAAGADARAGARPRPGGAPRGDGSDAVDAPSLVRRGAGSRQRWRARRRWRRCVRCQRASAAGGGGGGALAAAAAQAAREDEEAWLARACRRGGGRARPLADLRLHIDEFVRPTRRSSASRPRRTTAWLRAPHAGGGAAARAAAGGRGGGGGGGGAGAAGRDEEVTQPQRRRSSRERRDEADGRRSPPSRAAPHQPPAAAPPHAPSSPMSSSSSHVRRHGSHSWQACPPPPPAP